MGVTVRKSFKSAVVIGVMAVSRLALAPTAAAEPRCQASTLNPKGIAAFCFNGEGEFRAEVLCRNRFDATTRWVYGNAAYLSSPATPYQEFAGFGSSDLVVRDCRRGYGDLRALFA
jgi:hypothetical protein